ncbi:MAG: ATP-binding cassette domain-containing protein [Clostridiales Family XIII bacterium]|nr:ATP-binding cassette domain-containing protein [Clostridiales Family XIII bacterium]
MDARDRDIAMVFQSYALYPHMTVYANMAFALKLRKVPKDEIDRKVREAAKILDIEGFLARKPKALSGGQRQRVAIGRAIVRDPEVFLMDEPLSNLDAKLRNQMRAEIIRLRSRINTTFLYVTHDQTEAMTLGDRIVIMDKGSIQQVGTPDEVFNFPANLFVSGFIGVPQMNYFSGKLYEEGGTFKVGVGRTVTELNAAGQSALRKHGFSGVREVVVGVRPEHVVIRHGEDVTKAGTISSVISVAEPMGSEMLLHVDVEDGFVSEQSSDIILRVIVNENSHAFVPDMKIGKPVAFYLHPDMIHIFDEQTGDNIVYPYVHKG